MTYIVLDLEWNQPISYQSRAYREVGSQLIFEMIQIGAVKLDSERRAFSLAGDSFRKIIVRDDILHRTFDETGVLHVNLLDFLLDETIV